MHYKDFEYIEDLKKNINELRFSQKKDIDAYRKEIQELKDRIERSHWVFGTYVISIIVLLPISKALEQWLITLIK